MKYVYLRQTGLKVRELCLGVMTFGRKIDRQRKNLVRTTGLVCLAAAIGLGYTLYLFPIPFLAGSAPWWNDVAPQDVKQTITGLRYFTADDWQFPIFRTLKVNPPEGLVIIYTDSIPLFAFRWLKPEAWGAWTYSGIAGPALRMERPVTSNLTLIADARAFVAQQHPEQLVDVAVNGQIVGSWKFTYGELDTDHTVAILAETATRQSPMRISFYIHDMKPLFNFRLYGSARLLGVGMQIVAEMIPKQ